MLKFFQITKVIIELAPIEDYSFNIANYTISGKIIKKLLILINALLELVFMLLC